jgi:hypothetical protein
VSTEVQDARTTPGWLRGPAVLLLLAQLAVFGLGFAYAHGMVAHSLPRWVMKAEPVAFFGNWKMFTTVDKKQRDLDGYALYDGVWERIDLPMLFPSRWESGPRYARKTIRRSGRHLAVFAAATCGRLEQPPERVKLVDIRWRSKRGRLAQPRKGKVRETQLIDWDCGRQPPKVSGRPI